MSKSSKAAVGRVAQLSPEVVGEENPACLVALRRANNATTQENLLAYCVLAIALGAVAAVLIAIGFAIAGKGTGAILAGAGAAVSGIAAGFVLRTKAKADRLAGTAITDAQRVCKSEAVLKAISGT